MEDKKYYWIKLRTDFFNQETIDFLLSQPNGCEYVVLYQMLCLQTANTNGLFANQIGEVLIPYNIEKIVRDTKYFDYDTIAVALELYKKIGLVYTEEQGYLKITDFDKMIGSETAWAEKKRIYREKQRLLKDKVEDNVLEEYRDKRLENRNNNIKEINKEKYGEFNNVLLTEEEYHKLEQANLLPYIEKLSSYIASKGKKYKSHYATILTWSRGDKQDTRKHSVEPEWMDKEIVEEETSDEIKQLLKYVNNED